MDASEATAGENHVLMGQLPNLATIRPMESRNKPYYLIFCSSLKGGKTRFGMIIAALPQVRSPQQIQKPLSLWLSQTHQRLHFCNCLKVH